MNVTLLESSLDSGAGGGTNGRHVAALFPAEARSPAVSVVDVVSGGGGGGNAGVGEGEDGGAFSDADLADGRSIVEKISVQQGGGGGDSLLVYRYEEVRPALAGSAAILRRARACVGRH